MTALVVRSPLQSLSMTSTQRTAGRRRSARLAFQEDEPVVVPAVKRAKTGSGAGTSNDAEEVNGVNGAGNKAEGKGKAGGAARGKAAKSASYEEDDDGFTFSRGRSRKTAKKPTTAPVQEEPEPEPAPPKVTKPAKAASTKPAPSEPAKKSRATKKSLAAIAPAVAEEIEPGPKRRRSARLSGDNVSQSQPQPVATPAAEKTKRTRNSVAEKETRTPKSRTEDEGLALVGSNDAQPQSDQRSREGTKIALPFADTPIIKRNKELRKGGGSGHRRSSTGLRGRRASSLIDSGTSNAVPHAEVATEEFYKLIEDSLPEPRRMKQLLVWCGTRALPEKPSGDVQDSSAIMAARAIQQELLQDFASKSEMSNWFDREDVEPTTVVKKPNPRNEDNAKRLEELEAEVKRLQEEKKTWERLLKKPEALSSGDGETLPDAPPADPATAFSLDSINPTLLDPEQANILQQLKGLSLNLEPSATSTTSSSKPSDIAPVPSSSKPEPSSEPPKAASEAPAADVTQPDPSSTSQAPAEASSSIAPPTQQQQADISTRLRTITAALPAQTDLFADGVHKLAQYRAAADRVADAVLASAAQRLEQRDREARERAGTTAIGSLDVLRGLAGVLSGGTSGAAGGGDGSGDASGERR